MLARTDEHLIGEVIAAVADAHPLGDVPQTDLRQAVRDLAAARGATLKAVAKEAGVAESTFTAWISGTYKGNNEKIEEKARIWLTSAVSFSRQKIVAPDKVKFVYTPSAMKMMAALEFAQASPDVALIHSSPGMGKTMACLQYQASFPNVWLLTACDSVSSPRTIAQYLLEILGIAGAGRFRMREAICERLQGSQGLIVVDEAQKLGVRAIDQLRVFHDLAGVGLAFVGSHGLWEVIAGGGWGRKAALAQLYSRVGVRVNLTKNTSGDAQAVLDAEGVADEKQRKTLTAIAQRNGALRQMDKVLRRARDQAFGAEEELETRHIVAAWDRLSGGEGLPI